MWTWLLLFHKTFSIQLKNAFFSLLATGLFALASCGDASNSTTETTTANDTAVVTDTAATDAGAKTMLAHEQMTQYADLKAFIGKTLPVVQLHLGMVKMHPNMKM